MVNCQGRFATAVSFGTLATLVGAVGTRIMRNRKPVLAVIHPTMPINKNEITKEMIEKAIQCKTADELIALAKTEGCEITKEEAEAYMAELQGGSIMKGWTNDDRMMIACCNDGTRPVIFKIERIDIPENDEEREWLAKQDFKNTAENAYTG